jgi:curved DNA-binding protein CbpA
MKETQDINLIKSAYRKRIKEIHPDISQSSDTFKQHLLFIQVNQAYERLANKYRQTSQVSEPKPPPADSSAKAIVNHKDPAYVFYKTGIGYFAKIHPSQWNLDSHSMLETLIPGHEEDQEIMRNKVREITRFFPKAYYYFSIVVHEYPESIWAQDAKDKMSIIEERTTRYKRIIESFGR